MIWLNFEDGKEQRLHIEDAPKVNASGKVVTVRASSSRQATEYDKFAYKGYVNSSYWLEFKGEKAANDAKKLEKGDNILMSLGTLTSGEKYAEEDGKGKYSQTKINVIKWKFNDKSNSNRSDAKSGKKFEEPEDDFPD